MEQNAGVRRCLNVLPVLILHGVTVIKDARLVYVYMYKTMRKTADGHKNASFVNCP